MMDGWQLVALLLGWGSQAAHAWRMNKEAEREAANRRTKLETLERAVERLVREREENVHRYDRVIYLLKELHGQEKVDAALEALR